VKGKKETSMPAYVYQVTFQTGATVDDAAVSAAITAALQQLYPDVENIQVAREQIPVNPPL
jgi:hypothetical protein